MKKSQMIKQQNLITHFGFKPSQRAGVLIRDVIDAMIALKILPKSEIALSVSVFSLAQMRKLNKRHRRKDTPTDVLSFEQDLKSSPRGYLFLGDLVICMDVARRQAREHKHSERVELTILLVHGILHLLGFDHEKSSAAAKKMSALEAKVLKKLGEKNSGLVSRSHEAIPQR